jgi:hypothetical protein
MKTKKTAIKASKTVQPKRRRALYMDGRGKKRMVDLDSIGNPIIER